MLEIHLVLVFMIAAAVIAVEVRDLLSGIVGIGAVGIGLCTAFLLLKAPDLAMMQLVVEILSLVILVRATSRTDLPFTMSGRWVFNTVVTVVFMAAFLAAAYLALRHLPAFGDPEMRVAELVLDREREGNIVASLTSGLRVFDTLGEVAVFFAAIVGVLAVARSVARQKETR